jgi:hypothetical protein
MTGRPNLIKGLKSFFAAPTHCRECGAPLSWSEEISFDFFMPLKGMSYKETRWYQLYGCSATAMHQVYGKRRTRISHDGPWD